MNFIKTSVFLAAIAAVATGCTKQPEACINSEKDTYHLGDKVIVNSDCSENTYESNWSFLYDGSTVSNDAYSTGREGTYKAPKVGKLEVKLTANSKNRSKNDETSVFINIEHVCYTCIHEQQNITKEVCSQDYNGDWWTMYVQIRNNEEFGYTCNKK